MELDKIKNLILTPEYNFLRDNEHLGSNIILLTLGGSHAYGTNIDSSDVDIRGVATNTKEEILLCRDFEQVVNTDTDTTVYSIRKILNLLINVNPNTIEMLGNKKEHYLILTDAGKLLLDNKHIFLSKRCVHSFGGYANQQLRRLTNKSSRTVSQAEKEQHILNSIKFASNYLANSYGVDMGNQVRLYLDDAVSEEKDKEIFMDIQLNHYPLRDYNGLWAEMSNIVRDYDKFGHRNANAVEKGKLAKHMMHLVRLYLMCFDILENGEINTYREKDHDFLMSIRNGKYLDQANQPTLEFMEMVNSYESKLQILADKTELPDQPDYDKVDKLMYQINEAICSK